MAQRIICLCPKCGTDYEVEATFAGKRLACDECGQLFVVPRAPAAGGVPVTGGAPTGRGRAVTPPPAPVPNPSLRLLAALAVALALVGVGLVVWLACRVPPPLASASADDAPPAGWPPDVVPPSTGPATAGSATPPSTAASATDTAPPGPDERPVEQEASAAAEAAAREALTANPGVPDTPPTDTAPPPPERPADWIEGTWLYRAAGVNWFRVFAAGKCSAWREGDEKAVWEYPYTIANDTIVIVNAPNEKFVHTLRPDQKLDIEGGHVATRAPSGSEKPPPPKPPPPSAAPDEEKVLNALRVAQEKPGSPESLTALRSLLAAEPEAGIKEAYTAALALACRLAGDVKRFQDIRAALRKRAPNSNLLPLLSDEALREPCADCAGTGKRDVPCAKCKGTGLCTWPLCDNGLVKEGRVYKKCFECGGSGRCKKCGGRRRELVECKTCWATGFTITNARVKGAYLGILEAVTKYGEGMRSSTNREPAPPAPAE